MELYNIDTLQELYAFKYYQVYHLFPKFKKTENNRELLIFKINMLSQMKEKGIHQNGNS